MIIFFKYQCSFFRSCWICCSLALSMAYCCLSAYSCCRAISCSAFSCSAFSRLMRSSSSFICFSAFMVSCQTLIFPLGPCEELDTWSDHVIREDELGRHLLIELDDFDWLEVVLVPKNEFLILASTDKIVLEEAGVEHPWRMAIFIRSDKSKNTWFWFQPRCYRTQQSFPRWWRSAGSHCIKSYWRSAELSLF